MLAKKVEICAVAKQHISKQGLNHDNDLFITPIVYVDEFLKQLEQDKATFPAKIHIIN